MSLRITDYLTPVFERPENEIQSTNSPSINPKAPDSARSHSTSSNLSQKTLPSLKDFLFRIELFQINRIAYLNLDPAGLIYWASSRSTKREIPGLLREGISVPIEGLDATSISSLLRPGMLIVWDEHVLVITTSTQTTEVSHRNGTVSRPLGIRLQEIMRTRTPLNEWPLEGNPSSSSFVVRNLYPQGKE